MACDAGMVRCGCGEHLAVLIILPFIKVVMADCILKT
jgi:hypothetical protein